jgi:hypothetical protein
MAVEQHRGDGDAGAAAVEFGLLLIPLVLIIFGIVEFGLYFNRAQGMQAAAREGGRVAAVGFDLAEVEERVVEVAPPTINPDHIDVSAYAGSDPSNPDYCTLGVSDEFVTVEVSIVAAAREQYGLRIPLGPVLDAPSFESTAVFRCERIRS